MFLNGINLSPLKNYQSKSFNCDKTKKDIKKLMFETQSVKYRFDKK